MRFLILAALSLVLVTPLIAHAESPHVFASAICRQKLPCPSGSNEFTPKDWATAGDHCIMSDLAFGASSEYFDDQSGLDSNNCLTPKSLSSRNGSNDLHPKCCIVSINENTCAFSCEVTTQK